MKNSSILARSRSESWFQPLRIFLRENATAANLVGLLGGLCALFLFVALPMPWNIRLPFYLMLLVWIILRPRVALYLMPLAVPWGSLDTLTVAGLNVNSADILVLMLGVGWLMSYAMHPMLSYEHSGTARYDRGPRDRATTHAPTYLLFAIVALLCAMLLSMSAAISISSSLKEISKWLEFLVLILVGSQYIRTRQQLWLLVVMICLAGVSQGFYGFLQAFFNLGPQSFIRDTSLRVYGTFGQPNPYAGYINIPLSIALALLLLGSKQMTRILAGLTAVLLAITVYLTQSRGAEIALVSALVFIVIVGMPHLRRPLALLALAVVCFLELFFAGWIPTYVLTPVFKLLGTEQISFVAPSPQDYSTAERLAHWIAGIRMFVTHPLTGVGIGNYPDAYPRYYLTIFVNSLGHAHNYYINIAAETGAIGLIAFLLFLTAIFVAGGRAFRAVNHKYEQARAVCTTLPDKVPAPLGWRNKLSLLLQPVSMVKYYRPRGIHGALTAIVNDRALAIGLLAALLSVCVHNLVDDLYVHSVTNLIALLIIALICLPTVTADVANAEKIRA
ncbi:MAG: O-antigen ligase family protein [Ktedonobacteraceae bacterium]